MTEALGACCSPRFSIVTLSYNQGKFLAQAIESVLKQDYRRVEYIVVDPGSTDGSRDIIRDYSDKCSHVVLESDSGPAEGLNHGFQRATGQYYGFLNADDVLLPGALTAVAAAVRESEADVLSGHSVVIDEKGRRLRRAYSDPYSLRAAAYGACVLMQPSTFFNARWLEVVGGFNVENRTHWDGELFADMAIKGARFSVVPKFLSGFRLHPDSISASPASPDRVQDYRAQVYAHIMGHPPGALFGVIRSYYLMSKYLHRPAALRERVLHGAVSGRLLGTAGDRC